MTKRTPFLCVQVRLKLSVLHKVNRQNADADGDSHRTLEVIDPNGEVVRTYTFAQDGFISGNEDIV